MPDRRLCNLVFALCAKSASKQRARGAEVLKVRSAKPAAAAASPGDHEKCQVPDANPDLLTQKL